MMSAYDLQLYNFVSTIKAWKQAIYLDDHRNIDIKLYWL